MLAITPHLSVPLEEIEISAMRAQGAGGQHVNKTSSAVHLRFDIKASTLPEDIKQRLCELRDHRITRDGCVIIKAQESRSQEQNRREGLERLGELIRKAAIAPRKRRATRPTRSSQRKRVDSKVKHGKLKALRRKVDD